MYVWYYHIIQLILVSINILAVWQQLILTVVVT